jgi:ribosomal protein L30E
MSLIKLKKALSEQEVVFGTERTIKALKTKKVSEVFISKNCPEDLKERIIKYSKINGANVNELKEINKELGAVCKKPFAVNVCYY